MAKTVKCSEVWKDCIYAWRRNVDDIFVMCDYMDVTGKRRGCDPEACVKYQSRKKYKRVWTYTGKPVIVEKKTNNR